MELAGHTHGEGADIDRHIGAAVRAHRQAAGVGQSGVTDVRGARRWLKTVVEPSTRGTAEAREKRDVSPHLRPASVLTCDPLSVLT